MNRNDGNIYIYPKILKSINPEESKRFLYIFQNNNAINAYFQKKKDLNIKENKNDFDNENEKLDVIDLIIELQNGKKKRKNIFKKIIFEFISKSDIYEKIKEKINENYEKLIKNSNNNNNKNNNNNNNKREYIELKMQEKINLLSENLKFEKRKKGEFLIKLNDKMNYIYFVVIGRLSLLKLYEFQDIEMTYEEYIKYLLDLKSKKEIYLLEKVLKINNSNLSIESLLHFKQFIKVYFLIKINKELKNNIITFPQIEDYINKYQLKFEDLDLNKKEMEEKYIKSIKLSNNQWNDYIKKCFQINNDNINFFNPFKFIFHSKNNKLNYNIFRYDFFSYLKSGNYFGDESEENLKNTCVRIEENSIIAFITRENYNKIIFENVKNEKYKEIMFLLEYFIFKKISPIIFEKYYFSFFEKCEFKKNTFLYNQNSEILNLYIINEGQVIIYFYGNLIDIYNEIKFYIDFLIKNNHIKLSSEELNELKELYLNDPELKKIKTKDLIYKEEIYKKQIFEIYILEGYNFFSLEEFFLSKNHLTSCKINSENAILYKINTNNFKHILNEEKNIKCDYYNLVYSQIISFIKRLDSLKKNIFNIANYKSKISNQDIKNSLIYKKKKSISPLFKNLIYKDEINKNLSLNYYNFQKRKTYKLLKNRSNNIIDLNQNKSLINKEILSLNNSNNNNLIENKNKNLKIFSNLKLNNNNNISLQNESKTKIKIKNCYINLDSIQNEFLKQKKLISQKEENKNIIGVNLLSLNEENCIPKLNNNYGFIGFKTPKNYIRKNSSNYFMNNILKNISETLEENLDKKSPNKILVNSIKKYYQNFHNYSNILNLENNKFYRSSSLKNLKSNCLIKNN